MNLQSTVEGGARSQEFGGYLRIIAGRYGENVARAFITVRKKKDRGVDLEQFITNLKAEVGEGALEPQQWKDLGFELSTNGPHLGIEWKLES